MTFKNIFFLISFCVSATFLLSSCNGEGNASSFQRDTHTVWVHQLSDPDGLNPYISQGASAGYIKPEAG